MGVGVGGAAAPHGPAYDGLGGRRAARRRGAGADPGRGADVPLQQPRRAADAAAHRRRPYATLRAVEESRRPPGTRCAGSASAARSSGSRSSPRCCRRSWCCRRWRWSTCCSPHRALAASGSATCSSPSARWCSPAAGGSRSSSSGRPRRRPYIGGSQTNSILELTLGYNGFGRLTGDETGSVGGGNGWGETGLTAPVRRRDRRPDRLAAAGGAAARRRPRCGSPDGSRAVRAALTALAGLAGRHRADLQPDGRHLPRLLHRRAGPGDRRPRRASAPVLLWRQPRLAASPAACSPCAVAATSVTSFVLLDRATDWHALAEVRRRDRRPRRGPDARSASGTCRRASARRSPEWRCSPRWPARRRTPSRPRPPRTPARSPAPGRRWPGASGPAAEAEVHREVGLRVHPTARPAPPPPVAPARRPTARRARPARRAGGAGGLLDGSTPSAEITALLEADADSYTWVAAAVGSNTASGYQLATEQPVMAIGGFNGSDPSPTLAQFQAVGRRRRDPLLHRRRPGRRRAGGGGPGWRARRRPGRSGRAAARPRRSAPG